MTTHADGELYVPGVWVLREIIRQCGDSSACDEVVRRTIAAHTTELIVLGSSVGAARTARFLHAEVQVRGVLIRILPVFTDLERVNIAVAMNPGWAGLVPVSIEGRVALEDREPSEWLAIDPWSGHEFKLPPEGRWS